MTVVPTSVTSRYYGRPRPGVPETVDQQAKGSGSGASQDLALSVSGSSDLLDLSPSTLEILKSFEEELNAALEAHPKYRHIFPVLGGEAGAPQIAIARLGQLQRFLNDPHQRQRAAHHHSFAQFYQSMAQLGARSQDSLARAQRVARDAARSQETTGFAG